MSITITQYTVPHCYILLSIAFKFLFLAVLLLLSLLVVVVIIVVKSCLKAFRHAGQVLTTRYRYIPMQGEKGNGVLEK